MKKFLFVVAALATSMAASAQLWVSGGLNIANERDWNDDNSGTSWSINPAIGYALDDALEVGLSFDLNGYNYDKTSRFGFNIAPFARYTFLSAGDFSMFLECSVGYTYDKWKDADKADWEFDAKIRPGVKYTLTDNFAMVAKLGKGLFFHHDQPDGPSTWTQNEFGFDFTSALSFGLVYSF